MPRNSCKFVIACIVLGAVSYSAYTWSRPPLFADRFGIGIIPTWTYVAPLVDHYGNEIYIDYRRNIVVLLMFHKDRDNVNVVRSQNVTRSRATFAIGNEIVEVSTMDKGLLILASEDGCRASMPLGQLSARQLWHVARMSEVGTTAGEWNVLDGLQADPVIGSLLNNARNAMR